VKAAETCILTVNAGSSSIRFAAYDPGAPPRPLFRGKIDRIGLVGTRLTAFDGAGKALGSVRFDAHDHDAAAGNFLRWLGKQPAAPDVIGIGHRVVHGMRHSSPERVTSRLLTELRGLIPFAPDHLPAEIALIKAFRHHFPSVPQVACFDTAFHRTLPALARLLPIPRRYARDGVERYGFHGLSFEFLLGELRRLGDPAALRGRVILAHLGNGASLAAVLNGRSVDTSMGFTPASGLVMSTRTGDLDPGVLSYLGRQGGLTEARLATMVNHESGLLGVSGTSPDMRDLLARASRDPRAAEAVGLFCYQAKKWIGSFAAVLGGVDTLVFAGGIGENAAPVRRQICAGLGFLGIRIDGARNSRGAKVISSRGSRVTVRVIRTDEESVIASSIVDVLRLRPGGRTTL
jgi:acetate kinase